jgi:hypothetical protein
MRVVSRRLTDYRMYVYGSLAYLEKATPIVTMQDLKNHPFIGSYRHAPAILQD